MISLILEKDYALDNHLLTSIRTSIAHRIKMMSTTCAPILAKDEIPLYEISNMEWIGSGGFGRVCPSLFLTCTPFPPLPTDLIYFIFIFFLLFI
jgi:hypothetical protein